MGVIHLFLPFHSHYPFFLLLLLFHYLNPLHTLLQCVYHMPIEEDLEAQDGGMTNTSNQKKRGIAEALQRLFYNLQTSENEFVGLPLQPSFSLLILSNSLSPSFPSFSLSSPSLSEYQPLNLLSHSDGIELMLFSSMMSKN